MGIQDVVATLQWRRILANPFFCGALWFCGTILTITLMHLVVIQEFTSSWQQVFNFMLMSYGLISSIAFTIGIAWDTHRWWMVWLIMTLLWSLGFLALTLWSLAVCQAG